MNKRLVDIWWVKAVIALINRVIHRRLVKNKFIFFYGKIAIIFIFS